MAVTSFYINHNLVQIPSKMKVCKEGEVEERLRNTIAAVFLAASVTLSPISSANAYTASDYASETVKETVKTLKDAGTSSDKIFKSYEDIAAIITEGKGVGGEVNYKGVKLNRGYVADEDTAIYNPGLTLLTESEKERIVEAVINARKASLTAQSWNEDNEIGYQFLKEKLDPLHMIELKSYLNILPSYGAVVYLVVIGIQQFARGIFKYAYLAGALLVFLPILALVAAGPQ